MRQQKIVSYKVITAFNLPISKCLLHIYVSLLIIFNTVDARFSLGPGKAKRIDDPLLEQSIVEFYHEHHPTANVLHSRARIPTGTNDQTNFVNTKVQHLKYIVLDGRRIHPSADVYRAPNSIIQSRHEGKQCVGQVISILKHSQRLVAGYTVFLHVRWFLPLPAGILNTAAWDK